MSKTLLLLAVLGVAAVQGLAPIQGHGTVAQQRACTVNCVLAPKVRVPFSIKILLKDLKKY
jgi:hypothetical protein